MEVINFIEQKDPGKFRYCLTKDSGYTGNLEIFVFGPKDAEGTFIWSKKKTNQFPKSDWAAFLGRIKDALD